jgi:DNA-binding transcriptional LysR family regulator
MEIRHLRYFIAVAEELSFSRAAKRLNVSQPPLSVQIQALEAEVGVALFIRNRRKVELTPAGQLLLEHARRAVKHLEHTTNVVRRAGRGEAGVIRLAFHRLGSNAGIVCAAVAHVSEPLSRHPDRASAHDDGPSVRGP